MRASASGAPIDGEPARPTKKAQGGTKGFAPIQLAWVETPARRALSRRAREFSVWKQERISTTIIFISSE